MGLFLHTHHKCEEKERGWGLGRRGGREKGRKEKQDKGGHSVHRHKGEKKATRGYIAWCSVQYVICFQHCVQDPIHLF